MKNKKLRLGILIDSFLLPSWACHSLERVVNLDCIDICLVILNKPAKVEASNDRYFDVHPRSKLLSYARNLDRAVFRCGPDAFSPRDSQALLQDVPVVYVQAGRVDPIVTHHIKNSNIDILIRLGFEEVPEGILTAARYGVWSYCYTDQHGFWEVVKKVSETKTCLYVLNHGLSKTCVLYRSSVQTYPLSPFRNRNRCFWASSSFLARQIELLFRLGDKAFFDAIAEYGLDSDDCLTRKQNDYSAVQLFLGHVILLFRSFWEFIRRICFSEHWYLLFAMGNDSLSPSFSEFHVMEPGRDRFWADPHIVQTQDKYFIFIEELVHRDEKGRISVIEMEKDGSYKEPVPIISKDYHLSYPFVFLWNDHYYMVPETSGNRTIELYECARFPDDWRFKMNLMENVIAVDTTLFYDQGKWWLFTGINENEGALPEVELFLFHSKDLFTQNWIPHPMNPIISDVKNARPAGAIFIDKGRIFRPAQDCSRDYGWALNINEITKLSETGYREKIIAKHKPNWDRKIAGIHTFARLDSLTIVDVRKNRLRIF